MSLGPALPARATTLALEGDKAPQDPTTATAPNAGKAAALSCGMGRKRGPFYA